MVSVTVEKRLSSSESKKLVVSRSLLAIVDVSPYMCRCRSRLGWPLRRGAARGKLSLVTIKIQTKFDQLYLK